MLPFCYLDEALGAFTLPTAQEIQAKRAVVVTCGAAGLLREAFAPSALEPPTTFSHILIDEAGQVCPSNHSQYRGTRSAYAPSTAGSIMCALLAP